MTVTENGAVDPLEGLDATQRAELEAAAARWAEPRAEPSRRPMKGRRRPAMADPVRVPVSGMLAVVGAAGAASPPGLRAGLTPERYERAAQLCAEADAEALAAAEAARKANRHASYLRNRNPRYADSTYAMLRPAQNPRGMISSWLERGPSTLTMAGLSRRGKTTAAYAITNDAHGRGLWTEVWTAKKISDGLRGDKAAVWARVTGCDVLLLDDLGRERVTDWWRDFLQELVDDRFGQGANGKRMIVTANTVADPEKAYDELLDRYGDPIVERILDHGGILIFDGPQIRNMVTEW